MTTFRHKIHSHASIPCLIALVVLLGGSLVSFKTVIQKKSTPSSGDKVSHIADEGGLQSGADRYIPVLSNGSSESELRVLASKRVSIDSSNKHFELGSRSGLVQGRAPPFQLLF